jgi:conjugal transfer/type IV secretion protein DotA/TraY
MALASSTPIVNLPTFEGLSTGLASDVTPFFDSATSLLAKLKTYVQSGDGITIPTGAGTLATSSVASTDGQSTISSLFNTLNLTSGLMAKLISYITPPTGSQWSDPFGSLIGLGQTLINAALVAMGLAGLASSTTGTIASTFTSFFTGGPGAAVASLALGTLMQFFATPIFYACLALLLPGLTIAYVLPMIPWILWIAGVAGYLILVCEALIAVPLWMLAHLTFEGEGLHGRGLAGYELLFNVLFRPVLMILGLFMGYFIYTCMSWLIRQSFGIAAGFVLGNGWFVTNFLGLFVLLSIFTMMHVTAAFMSFRLITQIPHHLPRMIGFSGQNRVDMDQFAKDAAIVGVAGTLGTLGTALSPKRLTQAGGTQQNRLTGRQTLIGQGNSGSQSNNSPRQNGQIDQTLQATTNVSHNDPLQET